MAKRDFYEILGTEKNADAAALKKAYRKQAMKFHPDRNPGDSSAEAAFKEVNEAYEILKDEQSNELKYCIVGPWDTDMEKGFISFMSPISPVFSFTRVPTG